MLPIATPSKAPSGLSGGNSSAIDCAGTAAASSVESAATPTKTGSIPENIVAVCLIAVPSLYRIPLIHLCDPVGAPRLSHFPAGKLMQINVYGGRTGIIEAE